MKTVRRKRYRENPETSRARASAQRRALARLAREFAERYAQLYAEERGVS